MTLQYTAAPYIALHPAVVYCAQSAVLICVNEGCGGDWVSFFGENERIVGGVSIMKNCYNCYILSNKTLHNRKAVILLSFKRW